MCGSCVALLVASLSIIYLKGEDDMRKKSAQVEREEEDTSDDVYKKGNKLTVGNICNAGKMHRL